MLYLIRSFGRGGRSFLKIGFSDNIDNRMNQYHIHNPLFEKIAQRPGKIRDEELLHLYLEALGYKANFLNEWFIDCPEVLTKFHDDLVIKVPRLVWDRREDLFSISDFTNPVKREVYEYLRHFWSNGVPKCDLDVAWKFAESREKLKKMKKNDFLNWF